MQKTTLCDQHRASCKPLSSCVRAARVPGNGFLKACCKDRTRIDLLVSQVTLKESGKLELGVLHLRPLNQVKHVWAEEQHQGHQHLLLVILVFKVWILVYLL